MTGRDDMILAFADDGTVTLHASEEDAVGAHEGIDVENQDVCFYRADGTYLKAVFTVPNRSGRFLRFLSWVESGDYRLVPDPGVGVNPLWRALLEHPTLEPSLGFSSMAQLKEHLASLGAVVEKPGGDGEDPEPDKA